MNKKLAIKGHPTRGKEIIKLLEMMGGTNPFTKNDGIVIGNKPTSCYTDEMREAFYENFKDLIEECKDLL